MTTFQSIANVVADEFAIPVQAIFSRARPDHIAFPRMVAMKLSQDIMGATRQEVGSFFGRHRADVLHAHLRVSDRMATEPQTREIVLRITRRILK